MSVYGALYGSPYGGVPPGEPDHVSLALGRRTERYSSDSAVNFAWLLSEAAGRWQRIDNVIHAMQRVLSLDHAHGVHLGFIGVLVAFDRPVGFDDTRYRRWIGIAILANDSSGTAPELQEIGHAMEPSSSPDDSRWDPVYPRGWVMAMPDLPGDEVGAAVHVLSRATAGGVDGRLVAYSTDGYLGFAEDTNPAAQPFADDTDMGNPVGTGVIAADYTVRGGS